MNIPITFSLNRRLTDRVRRMMEELELSQSDVGRRALEYYFAAQDKEETPARKSNGHTPSSLTAP